MSLYLAWTLVACAYITGALTVVEVMDWQRRKRAKAAAQNVVGRLR